MKLLDKTLASKKKKRDPFYGKARRLAKKMNVRITVERDDVGVCMWIETIESNYRDEKTIPGERFHTSWESVFDRLKDFEEEWSKLEKQQDAFDFSVEDHDTWHFCWIFPGPSWDFDPCHEEHFRDDILDAISMANCYIKEFPNRKTGKWSFEENRE
jgi:hypothetical protein|tara:strand:+ start:52 stop:522 length:471 start_codon:yes stop_codon:yes gene_type:complete